jgi:peptidoglycan/LPS O-acetylase OafA/YrhL
MNRSFGLDLARAAAIGLVLISHFVKKLEFLGVFGVELFFALSGFLIGGVLHRALSNSPRWCFEDVRIFWLRRWYRTVPNYVLFLLVALVFHAHFGGLPSPGLLASHLVFAQNLFSGDNSFFGVSWSLAVEEWFYLTFPLTILVFTVVGLKRRSAFLATTILFVVVPPLLRELAFLTEPGAKVRLMTLPRLDAIFYGVGVAFLIASKPWGRRARRSGMVAGSLVMTSLLILLVQNFGSTTAWRTKLILAPAAFAVMLPWLQGLAAPTSAWLRGSVTNLSLWSYSIYLSHIPVLFVVYELFGDARRDVTAINLLSKAVGLVACLAISRLIYIHFEHRITQMRPQERRGRSVGGIVSATVA